jgi:uncharacterized protein (DUF1697 family)
MPSEVLTPLLESMPGTRGRKRGSSPGAEPQGHGPRAQTSGWIVLLRAVNLGGGTQVDLARLAERFARSGLHGARSLLNSGNFVGRADVPSGEELATVLSATAELSEGRPVRLFVRSASEWSTMIAANPFPREARDDPGHLVVSVLDQPAPREACRRLTEAANDGEIVRPFGRHAFVYFPIGIGRSRLTAKKIEAALGSESTSRNWNTVLKLARAVELPES